MAFEFNTSKSSRPRRKKKNQAQSKPQRSLQVDADGWTHVNRGPSVTSANSHPNSRSSASTQALLTSADFPSLAALRLHYTRLTTPLPSSSTLDVYRSYLSNAIARNRELWVSHVVCLGLGRFGTGTSGAGADAMRQLAWLEELITLLKIKERIAEPVQVYFQDPVLDSVQKEFLMERGYHVIPFPTQAKTDELLESQRQSGDKGLAADTTEEAIPGATTQTIIPAAVYLTEDTFLFTPHLTHVIDVPAFSFGKPALYLGSSMLHLVDAVMTNDGAPQQPRRSRKSEPWNEDEGLKDLIKRYEWQGNVVTKEAHFEWCFGIRFGVKIAPSQSGSDIEDGHLAEEVALKAPLRIESDDNDKNPPHSKNVQSHKDSIAEATKHLDEARLSLDGDPQLKAIEDSLILALSNNPHLYVSEVICLGLRSLIDQSNPSDPPPFLHLAFLEGVTSILRNADKSSEETPVYIQDPSLTLADAQFLQSLDMQAIPYFTAANRPNPGTRQKHTQASLQDDMHALSLNEDPQSNHQPASDPAIHQLQCQPYLSANTLLFAPSVPRAVLVEVLRAARPAVYVGPIVDGEGVERRGGNPGSVGVDGGVDGDVDVVGDWVGSTAWYPAAESRNRDAGGQGPGQRPERMIGIRRNQGAR